MYSYVTWQWYGKVNVVLPRVCVRVELLAKCPWQLLCKKEQLQLTCFVSMSRDHQDLDGIYNTYFILIYKCYIRISSYYSSPSSTFSILMFYNCVSELTVYNNI